MAGPAETGRETTVYFHGIPGSPAELTLFGGAPPRGWLVPDRNDPAFDQNLDRIAKQLTAQQTTGPVRLIGFSLGAMIALRLASRLGEQVTRIDLVSPAAPLEGGDFLPRMAGGPVFRLAAKSPSTFAALAWGQALLARIAPHFLARQLFAAAQGEDAVLAASDAFHHAIAAMLKESLGHSSQAYRREIAAYVLPWAEELSRLRVPITIWQGQEDNWTPPDMAESLARHVPGPVALHRLEGLSHYSALRHFLDQSS